MEKKRKKKSPKVQPFHDVSQQILFRLSEEEERTKRIEVSIREGSGWGCHETGSGSMESMDQISHSVTISTWFNFKINLTKTTMTDSWVCFCVPAILLSDWLRSLTLHNSLYLGIGRSHGWFVLHLRVFAGGGCITSKSYSKCCMGMTPACCASKHGAEGSTFGIIRLSLNCRCYILFWYVSNDVARQNSFIYMQLQPLLLLAYLYS